MRPVGRFTYERGSRSWALAGAFSWNDIEARTEAAVEDSAVTPHASLAALLAAERIDHERRSLRLPVREFGWAFGDDATLMLDFVLPRGTFATAVLHEVLADAWDAGEGGEE